MKRERLEPAHTPIAEVAPPEAVHAAGRPHISVELLQPAPEIAPVASSTQSTLGRARLRLVASPAHTSVAPRHLGTMTYRVACAPPRLADPAAAAHPHQTLHEILDLLMRVGDGFRFRLVTRLCPATRAIVSLLSVVVEGAGHDELIACLDAFHRRVAPWLGSHRNLALFADPSAEERLATVIDGAQAVVELAPRERSDPWQIARWLPSRHETSRLSHALTHAGPGVAVVLVFAPVVTSAAEARHLAADPNAPDPLDPLRFQRRLFLTSTCADTLDRAAIQALGATLVGLPGRLRVTNESVDGFEAIALPGEEARARTLRGLSHCRLTPLASAAPPALSRVRSLATPAELARIVPALELGPMPAPPAPSSLPDMAEGARLGVLLRAGRVASARMTDADAAHHTYIVGASGRGKSTLVLNLALERAREGHGVTLLDPHGDLVDDFLRALPDEHLARVVSIDATDTDHPVGLNPLAHDPSVPGAASFVINELFRVFEALWDMSVVSGPVFEQYFRNALRLVLRAMPRSADLLHLTRVFSDDKFRAHLLETATDPLSTLFWRGIAERARGEGALAEVAPYVASKVDVLMSDDVLMPMLLQVEQRVDLGTCMDRRDIVLVRIEKGRLGGVATRLLGMIVVMRLLAATLARATRPRAARTPFHVFIDETQCFLTPSLAELIAEARKFGLRLTLANQNLAQLQGTLGDTLLGNAGTLVVCGVAASDAGRLAATMGDAAIAPLLTRLGEYRAIVRPRLGGKLHAPFELALIPPPEPAPGADLARRWELVRQRSRALFSTERSRVLAALSQRHDLPAFRSVVPGSGCQGAVFDRRSTSSREPEDDDGDFSDR